MVELDTSDLTKQMGRVSGGFEQLTVGLILAGMLIGSAIWVAFMYPLVDNSSWVYVYGGCWWSFWGCLGSAALLLTSCFA